MFKTVLGIMMLSCCCANEVYAEKPPAALRVLFIGNSYIYVNDLPKVLSKMAMTAKPKLNIETSSLTKGGYTLEKFLSEKTTLDVIRKGKFDVVVLQEQSKRPVSDKKKMHEAVRTLNAEIKKSKARTVLFMTWGRAHLPEMIEPLSEAYIEIGKELNVKVAPVGLAWQKSLKTQPELSLHSEDKSHPSQPGTYLAACELYATLTGKSPEGLSTGGLKEVSTEQAKFLQQIAWETYKKQFPEKPQKDPNRRIRK